ncbi:polysaccharide biosynthesis C-terminal domain-containing protein, partial [Enterococcus hirae]
LLPWIGFFGVVFSNLLAEIFVTVVRTKSFLNQTNFSFKKKNLLVIFCSSIIMWFVTRIITNGMSPTFLTNLIQVSIAVPIYFLLTSLFGYNPILSGLGKWKKEN